MSVANSDIFSLMLSRLLLSTALCDSRRRLRFSFAIAALDLTSQQRPMPVDNILNTHCFAAKSPGAPALVAVGLSAFPPPIPMPMPMSLGLPLIPIGGKPALPNAEKPPCTLSGVGRLNSPIDPMPMFVCSDPDRLEPSPCPWCIEFTPGKDDPSPLPGWNHPEACMPSGDRALLFCPDVEGGGIISGWVM